MEDDRVISYELVVLPMGRFTGLSSASEVTDDIVALARSHGVALGRASEDIEEVSATAEVADRLGIEPDEVVLKLDRLVRAADGRPLEWRVAFFYDPRD